VAVGKQEAKLDTAPKARTALPPVMNTRLLIFFSPDLFLSMALLFL
jgi:hypothetical protein